MSEHEWKIGDWCEYGGIRCYVFDVDEAQVHIVAKDCVQFFKGEPKMQTRGPLKNHQELKHLPCCTGWGWRPPKPIEPPEGCRLLGKDEIVEKGDEVLLVNGMWDVVASSVGKTVRENLDQSINYAYARKIEPQYRPFANAAEFKPHRDKWFRWKESKGTKNKSACHRVHSYSDTVVWVGVATTGVFYAEAFDRLEFEDGTPFGVKVS